MNRSLLVVVSGLPGSGKTTLSEALSERIGAVALSRDLARQQASGRLAAMDRLFTRLTGRHRRARQKQAGRRLQLAVAGELAAGRPVVVEAVADQATRHQLAALAADYRVPTYSIEVICSDTAELARRLRSRPGNWQRIVAHMAKSYQPAPEALTVDSRHTPATMAEQAVQFIRQHAPQHDEP